MIKIDFNCAAGRDFTLISFDFWEDFKKFFNQYSNNVVYQITYDNLQLTEMSLSPENGLNDFLHLQLEILCSIIQEKEKALDCHESLNSLKSSWSEFGIIKHLLEGNQHWIVKEYLRFIETQIKPIYDLKINSYEETLNIKHHKSFVRNKIEETGEVKLLVEHISEKNLNKIKEYLSQILPDDEQRAHFFQEFIGGRGNDIVYSVCVSPKKLCDFFNFLRGEDYLKTEKKAIAQWMSRKFKLVDSGKVIGTNSTLNKYINGMYDPKFLTKL